LFPLLSNSQIAVEEEEDSQIPSAAEEEGGGRPAAAVAVAVAGRKINAKFGESNLARQLASLLPVGRINRIILYIILVFN
jgi:hypothetical protein